MDVSLSVLKEDWPILYARTTTRRGLYRKNLSLMEGVALGERLMWVTRAAAAADVDYSSKTERISDKFAYFIVTYVIHSFLYFDMYCRAN